MIFTILIFVATFVSSLGAFFVGTMIGFRRGWDQAGRHHVGNRYEQDGLIRDLEIRLNASKQATDRIESNYKERINKIIKICGSEERN